MKRKPLLSLAIIIISLTTLINGDNYVFDTNVLDDLNRVPTLSNGHIGFVAHNDAVHINGVYNGQTGESHRARIPNYGRVQFDMCALNAPANLCTYSLDMRQALFRTTSVYEGYTVEMVTYAHRFYDKTIVNHVTIRRSVPGSTDIYNVRLQKLPGNASVDFDVVSETVRNIDGIDTTEVHLRTRLREHNSYQMNLRNVYVYSQSVDETISLASGENERTFTYIASFGSDKGSAVEIEQEYRSILPIRDTILSSHVSEWEKFWTTSGISVEGNDELDKSIHASLFFLSSALPSLNTSGLYQKPFYGLAPSGLGRGGVVLSEYQGHSFWDTEIWMLPPVLLLEPEWSKAALNYRFQGRIAAADIAKDHGYAGWRFPWEGGYTGCETTPDCCPQNPFYQQHITAGVAYAYRNQFFATHDEEWMKSEGCEMAYRTAEYWASRVEYNSTDKLYEIIGEVTLFGNSHNHKLDMNEKAILKKDCTSVPAYYKFYHDNDVYYSTTYKRAEQSNDTVVLLRDQTIGQIVLIFIGDGVVSILVKVLISEPVNKFPEHIKRIRRNLPEEFVIARADEVMEKLLLISTTSESYVSRLPNQYEGD